MGHCANTSKGFSISCSYSKAAQNDKDFTLETTEDEMKDMNFNSYSKNHVISTENSSKMIKPSTNLFLGRSHFHNDLNPSNFLEHISE